MTGKALAAEIGLSQNYVAKRLRDEAPFTLDDVEAIARVISDDGGSELVAAAYERHVDQVDHLADVDAARETRRMAGADPAGWSDDEIAFASHHLGAMWRASGSESLPRPAGVRVAVLDDFRAALGRREMPVQSDLIAANDPRPEETDDGGADLGTEATDSP